MEYFISKLTERLNAKGVQIDQYLNISEDGTTLICALSYSECSLVFTKHEDQWVFQQKLVASDGAANDWFGNSLSISSDGNTVLVGACLAAPDGKSQAGAAYIFTRSGSTWTQQAKLVASDADAGDWFGYFVSISPDGNTASVRNHHGKKYTFTYVNNTWFKGN